MLENNVSKHPLVVFNNQKRDNPVDLSNLEGLKKKIHLTKYTKTVETFQD